MVQTKIVWETKVFVTYCVLIQFEDKLLAGGEVGVVRLVCATHQLLGK